MKKIIVIMASLVLLALVVYFTRIHILEEKMSNNTLAHPNPESYITSTGEEISSPSGKYMLSLKSYDDNGVMSVKIVVAATDMALISDECSIVK